MLFPFEFVTAFISMLKKVGILSSIFVSRVVPIILALTLPSWFPGRSQLYTCLIAMLIIQFFNLLALVACLLACKDIEDVPCNSICITWFIILEQISLFAFLLCLFVF